MSQDAPYQIAEGRANYSIAVDVGITAGQIWQNTDIDYDVAIGGIPFIVDPSKDHPYQRETTQFRKNQYDTQRDPGEQSLTNWWIRSQSSFDAGNGIIYYDPFANPFSTTLASNSYRFRDSIGVDVHQYGQVTLLNRPSVIKTTTNALKVEHVIVNGEDYMMLLDTNIYLVTPSGSSTTLVTAASTSTPIPTMCNDGANVYYIDAGYVWSMPLTGGSATQLFPTGSFTSALLAWSHQRLVGCINNAVYQLTGSGSSLPTATYVHPDTKWKWTGVADGGLAIYASGYSGANSAIYMFTLDTTTGLMPTLTAGIVSAELPDGEQVHSLYIHLATYICIGTTQGVRIGTLDPNTGNINYGQILNTQTNMTITGFAATDTFVWCAGYVYDGVDTYGGCLKVDLTNPIDTLMFSISQDVYGEDLADNPLNDVCIINSTGQVAFIGATAATTSVAQIGNLGLWIQSLDEVYPSGWLDTGLIRYNMLEPKNYKRVAGRADVGITPSSDNPSGTTKGSVTIQTYDNQYNYYDVITYDNVVGTPEASITQPNVAQNELGLRFILSRDTTNIGLSPVFHGYQLKAVPATPRTRTIKVPVLNYDIEEDKYSVSVGYLGRAWERLAALENIESAGDVITFQDFRNGEVVQCLIESIIFINSMAPDRRLSNYEGILIVTIRTV